MRAGRGAGRARARTAVSRPRGGADVREWAASAREEVESAFGGEQHERARDEPLGAAGERDAPDSGYAADEDHRDRSVRARDDDTRPAGPKSMSVPVPGEAPRCRTPGPPRERVAAQLERTPAPVRDMLVLQGGSMKCGGSPARSATQGLLRSRRGNRLRSAWRAASLEPVDLGVGAARVGDPRRVESGARRFE